MVGGSEIGGIVMRKIGAGVGAIFGLGILLVGIAWAAGLRAQDLGAVGIFEGHGDVGDVGADYQGSVEYDAAKKSYLVAGSGENMWGGADEFQLAWKKMSGNVEVSAEITFWGRGRIRTARRW